MKQTFEQKTKQLFSMLDEKTMDFIKRGIEKEHLRVDLQGHIAQTPHPKALGCALTHPFVTTDFSEAQPEMVTPPVQGLQNAYDYLNAVNTSVYNALTDELLWPASMPPAVENEKDINIANYGKSNIARLKQIYRVGLSHRYGRVMQVISGIHYNFSLPDTFFSHLQKIEKNNDVLSDFRSQAYMKMVRTFRRYAFLLPYLFGASPACEKTSVHARLPAYLSEAPNAMIGQYATSLRMSDLGYQNDAQSDLVVSYDSVRAYASSLLRATNAPYPAFTRLGVNVNGQYRQLNDSILQIENEYYGFIRPKQIAKSGERPAHALCERGVAYVEIRLLDTNPLLPLGIDIAEMAFLDVFLVYCLLLDDEEQPMTYQQANKNFHAVAVSGRKPGLLLNVGNEQRSFKDWALALLADLCLVAKMMDQLSSEKKYQSAVKEQQQKIIDVTLTPSAKIAHQLSQQGQSYHDFCLACAQKNAQFARAQQQTTSFTAQLKAAVEQSKDDWQKKENESQPSFEAFLKAYFQEKKNG
jgi:glutamate--cysteine ligase